MGLLSNISDLFVCHKALKTQRPYLPTKRTVFLKLRSWMRKPSEEEIYIYIFFFVFVGTSRALGRLGQNFRMTQVEKSLVTTNLATSFNAQKKQRPLKTKKNCKVTPNKLNHANQTAWSFHLMDPKQKNKSKDRRPQHFSGCLL